MAESPPSFAEWLNNTGRALGYPTSAALARALGIQQSTVSRWKTKGAQPGVEHLTRISELFGVELKSLLVLAGYLPATGDEPLPQPRFPDPIAERIETSANLRDEKQREIIRGFWRRRLAEEADRIDRAIELAYYTRASYHVNTALVSRLMATNMPQHVDSMVRELENYAATIPVQLRSDGQWDEDAQLTRPRDKVGTPVKQVGAFTAQEEDGRVYIAVFDEEGDLIGWTAGADDLEGAFNVMMEWVRRLNERRREEAAGAPEA